ncbi:MAG: NAD(+)/NADH kinase [Lachnospiraceae bacterium]|nr:NAD(+)/NADH kinase [Lachnospiraceae bacterium]
MKHFYIITNRDKDRDMQQTDRIRRFLEEHGAVCCVQEQAHPEEHAAYKYTDAGKIPAGVECVLVLGGDGTLLQASRDLIDTGLPLLGINLGTLGYLAEVEMAGVEEALTRLLRDDYSIEERMMISGQVLREGRVLLEDTALNDIVVGRRGHLRVIHIEVYVNDTFLCEYRADGMIVSTPTGSTGYALSAGGPIVAPDASLMLLTAIAPHTLATRPVVLPDSVKITLRLATDGHDGQGAEVTFDGDTSMMLTGGDAIEIRRSERSARLVKISKKSFVEILRTKMN